LDFCPVGVKMPIGSPCCYLPLVGKNVCELWCWKAWVVKSLLPPWERRLKSGILWTLMLQHFRAVVSSLKSPTLGHPSGHQIFLNIWYFVILIMVIFNEKLPVLCQEYTGMLFFGLPSCSQPRLKVLRQNTLGSPHLTPPPSLLFFSCRRCLNHGWWLNGRPPKTYTLGREQAFVFDMSATRRYVLEIYFRKDLVADFFTCHHQTGTPLIWGSLLRTAVILTSGTSVPGVVHHAPCLGSAGSEKIR